MKECTQYGESVRLSANDEGCEISTPHAGASPQLKIQILVSLPSPEDRPRANLGKKYSVECIFVERGLQL